MDSLIEPLFLSILAFSALAGATASATTFRLEFHQRFSDPVRRWAAQRSATGLRPDHWPEKGSIEYYATLADHDRLLHGRALSSSPDRQPLTFSDGNVTFRLGALGYLHYTLVSLGTPSTTFLVALDTGSDLFWVPCDCIQCAPTSSTSYGFSENFELNIYSPNASSTSKRVPCNSSLCEAHRECSGDVNNCPYKVAYVSANTSSTGVLVEDVMHLVTEKSQSKVVGARIIFGCGQVQSGSFLDVAAPNGLFGLGMEKISVPSILSAAGLTADSFSMCFGNDTIGRIIFGDKGSPDQVETPFNLRRQSHPTYNISVTGLHVGTSLIDTNFSALFDSGTSFTYLADPVYTRLSEGFNSQVRDKRNSPNSRIPFEFCYFMSSIENTSLIPSISLRMKGGGQFSVVDPIIIISTEKEFGYCLAVVKSTNLNIIGQNFMTGQRIVFDREKLVLGWKKFDCYDVEDSNTLPINPRNHTADPPTVSVVPGSYNPEATKQTGNESQVTVFPSPSSMVAGSSSQLCFKCSFLTLILFILAIY